MRLIQQFLCAAALLGFVATAGATVADPKSGAEYLTMPAPQKTDTGKKVEVIEFFAYYCPHCDAFDPVLAAWVKKQGDNIVFKRVHVPRDENVLPQQRLFFTLEAMGVLEQYHSKVFHAMHNDRLKLNRDEFVFDWVEKAGINRNAFMNAYRGFGVQARVRRADAMVTTYGIDSWPMVAIDGRFVTSPWQSMQGYPEDQQRKLSEPDQQQMALKVMDFLVAKAKAEKK